MLGKTTLLLASIVVLLSTEISLGADCNEATDTVSIQQCYEKKYSAADKELNAVYTEAMKTLSEPEKAKLREAQKAWLKYRDASFELYIEKNKDLRSYGSVAVADYKATLVEKRVMELKYILSSPEGPAVKW